MNSRRLIVAPRGQNHARHRLTAVRVLERGEGDVGCDQLFWAGNVGSGSHDRRQNPKSSVSADAFPVCPRQQTYLPISELLPPPAFRERRHGGLARRLVAMRRPAVLVLSEARRAHQLMAGKNVLGVLTTPTPLMDRPPGLARRRL